MLSKRQAAQRFKERKDNAEKLRAQRFVEGSAPDLAAEADVRNRRKVLPKAVGISQHSYVFA